MKSIFGTDLSALLPEVKKICVKASAFSAKSSGLITLLSASLSPSSAIMELSLKVSAAISFMRERVKSLSRKARMVSAGITSRSDLFTISGFTFAVIAIFSNFFTESCVSTSNVRIVSISLPKKSMRNGNSFE